MTLRLVIDDGVGASDGLATDEMLARRVGEGASPPTLRLYTYRSHCALVGRFQIVDHEIHRRYCEEQGFQVGRRPTGGGAIIMGQDQLGVALAVNGLDERYRKSARSLMQQFSRSISLGLRSLGVDGRFRGKNDLEFDGRKIAGLGVHRVDSGGLLLHGSILVGLDVPLMLRVLKTPFAEITERELRMVQRRIATVRGVLGVAVPVDDVRAHIARGFEQAAGVPAVAGTLGAEEQRQARELEEKKYATDHWLEQQSSVPDGSGAATVATGGGVLEVRVTLAGGMLKAVFLQGDFFAEDSAVADLEASLRWHPSDRRAVRATIDQVYQRRLGLSTIPKEILVDAIVEAATAPDAGAATDGPYGCFVTPKEAGS